MKEQVFVVAITEVMTGTNLICGCSTTYKENYNTERTIVYMLFFD